jgi:hypothetical protein
MSKNFKIKIRKITMMLPLILCGYETWSLTLREERTLKVFETKVLRGVFGPKWEEVAGGWRRLHIEELHNLYT